VGIKREERHCQLERRVFKKCLSTTTRAGTKATYKTAYRAYYQYTGMTSTALTDEAIEDAKRDPRDRKDIVKARLIGFHSWLLNDYAVYSRGSEKKTPHQMVGKGLRETSHFNQGGTVYFSNSYFHPGFHSFGCFRRQSSPTACSQLFLFIKTSRAS